MNGITAEILIVAACGMPTARWIADAHGIAAVHGAAVAHGDRCRP